MAGESNLWRYIQRRTNKKQWIAQRHEDKFSSGIADLSFSRTSKIDGKGYFGWIELKHVPQFPKKPETIIKVRHYTDDQRRWLYKRWLICKKVFVLIKIDQEYFLFSGPEMVLIGRKNRAWYYDNCLIFFKKIVNFEKLFLVLDKN